MTTRIRLLGAGLVAAAALALSGCAPAATPINPNTDAPNAGPAGENEIVVFAAASLNEVFEEIADDFEAANPGTTVTFNFGGSSGLVTQLREGAAADVLATANVSTMAQAVDASILHGVQPVFATNQLTVVTEAGNPLGIEGIGDLADVTLVVCDAQVPCGSATEKFAEAQGVTLSPVSEELSVTDVLGKVTSGQADAGFVYTTDARIAGDRVTEVPLPDAPRNEYPIGVVNASHNAELAQQFVDFVLSPEGQQRLSDAGFGAP